MKNTLKLLTVAYLLTIPFIVYGQKLTYDVLKDEGDAWAYAQTCGGLKFYERYRKAAIDFRQLKDLPTGKNTLAQVDSIQKATLKDMSSQFSGFSQSECGELLPILKDTLKSREASNKAQNGLAAKWAKERK